MGDCRGLISMDEYHKMCMEDMCKNGCNDDKAMCEIAKHVGWLCRRKGSESNWQDYGDLANRCSKDRALLFTGFAQA